jgi:MoaA/NifB/PqqE/SkfB family radical SAM enzyme
MHLSSIKKKIKLIRIMIPAYIRSRFRPIPIWAHIFVNRKCNLRCEYCYVLDPSKKEMSTEGMLKTIDHLHHLGCRFISLMGGEPTLRKDLPLIVEHINQKGIISFLSTNGTLLTKEYIDRLGLAGIDNINLSVDSAFEYDVSKKDYTRSKEVLGLLLNARKKYGFEVSVTLVLTRKNIDNAIKTVKLVNSFRIPIAVTLIVANTYNDKPNDESLFFNSQDDKARLIQVMNQLIKMKRAGYNMLDPIQYYKDVRTFINGGLQDWYCCAGEYSLSIDCDGKVQICSGLPAENVDLFELDRNYYKRFRSLAKPKFKWCKKICFGSCYYDSSYYMKNLMNFFRDIFG